MKDKAYEKAEAERMAQSHQYAVNQAKYKGKVIIAPSSQLRMTIIFMLIGGIVAMSLGYPFLHDKLGNWMLLVYSLIGIVGAITSFFLYAHWFVVDESLE